MGREGVRHPGLSASVELVLSPSGSLDVLWGIDTVFFAAFTSRIVVNEKNGASVFLSCAFSVSSTTKRSCCGRIRFFSLASFGGGQTSAMEAEPFTGSGGEGLVTVVKGV